MVRDTEQFISCIEQAAKQFGLGPGARIIARHGDFGTEHSIEHVKVREGRHGPELIVQIAMAPNAG